MTKKHEPQAEFSLHFLRNALEQAERQVIRLDKANIGSFLIGLDQIEQMFLLYGQDKEAIRAEERRWENLRTHLNTNSGIILQAATNAGGLPRLRLHNAPAIGPWWYLDAKVAQHSRTQRCNWVAIIYVVAAAVLALWGVKPSSQL